MDTVFTDVPAWPGQQSAPLGGRDPRLDNQPPLEERILLEFEEDLNRPEPSLGNKTITARIAELLASAGRVPAITSEDIAGKVGDLVKQSTAALKLVDAARERHNRQLLNSQRSLKAKADGVGADLSLELAKLRQALNAFMAEEARKADIERRRRDEEARKLEQEARDREAARLAALREAAPEAEIEEAPSPVIAVEPVAVAKPVARGDLGARVGTKVVWKHEILSVRQVPDAYLKHPKVVAALEQVIGQAVRSGTREIKGVRIWETTEANVR